MDEDVYNLEMEDEAMILRLLDELLIDANLLLNNKTCKAEKKTVAKLISEIKYNGISSVTTSKHGEREDDFE